MQHKHDPIRHLKYLRQSMSQDNESIGFFLSAGCPLSVEMPEGKWPLIPDVANLSKSINDALAKDANYTKLLEETTKAGKNIYNIEDVLSFLRSLISVSKGGTVRGLSEAELNKLEISVCKIVASKLNVHLPNNETPYHRLCSWIGSIDRKSSIEIFTTNYDLLIEQALEEMEIPYFDGFVGSRKAFFDLRALEDNLIPTHWSRLWKIHGSINWYQENEGTQKKIFRSSEIKADSAHIIYPSHLKYEESRKMPYLALIDQLNRFIRKKSSFLILSGYSFNDGHINDAIVSALKSNPTAMVLGLMHDLYFKKTTESEQSERYPEAYRLAKKQHNLNIWTFDKAIIGTNLGEWGPIKNTDDDEVLSSFITQVKKTDHDDEFENQIRLGDFSNFTSFLKRIIGNEKENIHAKK